MTGKMDDWEIRQQKEIERDRAIEELIESKKLKNMPQCLKCEHLIIPYVKSIDRHMKKIPIEDIIGTCRLAGGIGNGFYDDCDPTKCENGTKWYGERYDYNK